MLKTRLLDLGRVTAVRSQTTYHAVAECAAADDDPTLCLLFPDRAYVSIGYHQEASKEVDLEYCREHEIPVVRRMVGGGAVLLDEDQLFFHLIVPTRRSPELGLPLRLADRYPRLARPAIAAYHKLGVPAAFRPINDIHVHGRKIGGTGMANIGEAFVFVGSMMIDFNHALMARVLKFSDEKMRDKVHQSMLAYVTSMRRETGSKLRLGPVRDALVASFGEELEIDLEPGELGAEEMEKAAELDDLFASDEWLHRISWQEPKTRRLAINCDVRFLEAEHKVAGGLLRMSVRLVDGAIDDLLLSGDFSLLPGEALQDIRRSFLGVRLGAADWQQRIFSTWQRQTFDMPGVTPEDFVTITRKLVGAASA